MIEGVQRFTQPYIEALPSKKNLDLKTTAGIAIVVFAFIAQAHNSYQTAAIGTAAYVAAIAVQILVTPLFKQFADESDNIGPLEQTIKDFAYQVTIVSITCGFAAVNPVWFGSTILINLFWNTIIEETHPRERIRNIWPLYTLSQIKLF